MIKPIYAIVIITTVFLSCNSNEKKTPMSEINVANAFIRDILDNHLTDAEQYLLKDTTNGQYFDSFKKQYAKKDKAELEKYKASDINVNEISYVTDTICIFNYSNNYNIKVKNKLKIVRVGGKWLVDFKYTFSGNL